MARGHAGCRRGARGAGGRRASCRKSGSLKARSTNAWPSRVYARITFAEHAVQLRVRAGRGQVGAPRAGGVERGAGRGPGPLEGCPDNQHLPGLASVAGAETRRRAHGAAAAPEGLGVGGRGVRHGASRLFRVESYFG